MPRYRYSSCACDQASSKARLQISGSRYLAIRRMSSSRDPAATVINVICLCCLGSSENAPLDDEHGIQNVAGGLLAPTSTGFRQLRPRPRKRARSVSYSNDPSSGGLSVINCATQIGGSSADRSRRHASSALQIGPRLGLDEQLVESWMRDGPRHGGQGSIQRRWSTPVSALREPWLISVMRRISASSSGDTVTST